MSLGHLTEAERKVRDAARDTVRKLDRKARKAAKDARPPREYVKARVRDLGFLSWLHEGIPCIACLIEGPPRVGAEFPKPGWLGGQVVAGGFPIEAAHQKHVAGKGGMLGKRPSDADSCPLCAWHHRLAPNACDPAQRKFWDRLGVSVADFCAALHAAFRNGESGSEVVRQFAAEAKSRPSSLGGNG